MQIKLDKSTVLSHDGRQFVLKKFKGNRATGKKEPIWEALAYTATIEGALEVYVNMRIAGSRATSISILIQEIKKIRKDIKKLCEGE